MRRERHLSIISCVWLCCLLLLSRTGGATGEGVHVATTATAGAAASVIDADADTAADVKINTFFRNQDNITTTDASSEKDIPGLEATDYKKVWRAIPNVEHFSPFITSVVPYLPNMKIISLSLGYTFPLHWPLAGASGEHKDWLSHTFLIYAKALMHRGPRPLVFPTILVPTKAAYKKLAADLKQHSGLPDSASVQDPKQKALLPAAVYQQLMRNLVVVESPKLSEAPNGQVVMTQGKVKLTLQVKPDGSRYLVSNTTTLKLVAMDVGCEHCGYLTVQLVDSFVVPHMSATPVKPDPLITQEDIKRLPEHIKTIMEGWAAMPKALSEMPGAAWGMLARQLPDSHQEALKKLPKLPSFSVNFSKGSGTTKP